MELNGTFGVDPDHDFIDPSGGYLLITLDRESGRMKVAIKAFDGRVLEEQTIEKKAR